MKAPNRIQNIQTFRLDPFTVKYDNPYNLREYISVGWNEEIPEWLSKERDDDGRH